MIGKKASSAVLFLASLIFFGTVPAQADPPANPPACAPVSALGSLQLAPTSPVLALRRGSGIAFITLINKGPDPAPLDLAASPVVECSSSTVITQAKAEVSLPDQAKSVASGASVNIRLSITGVTEASLGREVITNGGVPVGSVRIVEIDAPLNLTVAANGTSDKPLDYSYGEPVTLALRNGDSEPYHLLWEFLVDGQTFSSGLLDIPANGLAYIHLKDACGRHSAQAFCKGYSVVDPVHPTVKTGGLQLSLIADGSLPSGLLPTRTLPITLLMRRVGPTTSDVLSYGYAALILLLGGLLSFLGSSVLPIMQRKADLRTQVQDLANRTSTVSVRVDSYLRVLLRLERKRIESAITGASAWLPTSTDPLNHVPVFIDTLSRRLAAAERLDELRRKHDQISGSAPPSVTDAIDVTLQTAAEQLHSAALTDEELAAASASLDKAQAALNQLDDSIALARLIAGNLMALRTRLTAFPVEYYSDLQAALPGLFVILDPARGFDDPKNIVRPMFFAIDHGIAAIHLLLDYAMVRVTIPNLPTASSAPPPGSTPAQPVPNSVIVSPELCSELGANARKRLLERQCTLFELLGTLSWLALREATLLIQEMREDTYQDDILAEITKPGQAEIAIETQRTRPLLPIFFSIVFKDSRFNNAAALRRLVCHWSFPDGLQELSWKVCHYFTGRERMPAIPPSLPSQPGQPVPPEAFGEENHRLVGSRFSWFGRRPHRLPLRHFVIYAAISGRRTEEPKEVPVPPLHTTILLERTAHPDKARFVAEILRFLIAFGVALAGLLSGALDQLSKLDFISATLAILALGFGANSIKNLLTPPAPPAPPPARISAPAAKVAPPEHIV